jgi:Ca2+-binding EF-hand superfamily protein
MMQGSKPVSLIKFEKYDSDGDGNITKEQFRSLCYSLGHCFEVGGELDAAWTVLDNNGNGFVSYDEFLGMCTEAELFLGVFTHLSF